LTSAVPTYQSVVDRRRAKSGQIPGQAEQQASGGQQAE
jgi:hypothetical protein